MENTCIIRYRKAEASKLRQLSSDEAVLDFYTRKTFNHMYAHIVKQDFNNLERYNEIIKMLESAILYDTPVDIVTITKKGKINTHYIVNVSAM